MENNFFAYILRCNDGTLYTGYAKDLKDRLEKHNLGVASKFTRSRLPVELVYYEGYSSKSEAMSRECQIKNLSRQEKLKLIGDGHALGTQDEKKPIETSGESTTGTLYVCATPLGNLEDITLRVLRILKECDLIAAEDTRRTIKLLNHFEIATPLTSYHEHNEKTKGSKLIDELRKGKNIALVSDAGMPGISDPGHIVIKMALEGDISVVPVPGPTAGITALVASGLPTDRFVFEGFLPRGKKQRAAILAELTDETRTIILYEAPHRVKKTLLELKTVLGDRRIVMARELTKLHEEFKRNSITGVIDSLGDAPKGEICLIVEGAPEKEKKNDLPNEESRDLIKEVLLLIEKGLSKKEAIKEVASKFNLPKREVYNHLVDKGI